MDIRDIDALIEDNVRANAHRVLIEAVENVGTCTYAVHHPHYEKSFHLLNSFMSVATYRHGDHDSSVSRLKHKLFNDLWFHYHHMHMQPCLICDACRNRDLLWATTEESVIEIIISEVDAELVSDIRTPYLSLSPVPDWVVEWMHWMRRAGYWMPSTVVSPSQDI